MLKIKSFFSILIIFIILLSSLFIFEINISYALTQTISTDIDGINESQYPGYKQLIKNLKAQFPNWTIKVLYTDLDWNTVIANEYTGHGASPRNLIQQTNTYTNEWICSICGNKVYDNGSWRCASEKGIKYMMDPRNSLNVADIFQFEELTNGGYSNATVDQMVQGTFLQGHTNGIVNAANRNNINPYYIIARLLQEQGRSGSVLSLGNGYNGQYIGYYNAFNIGATGSGKDKVILNGLAYAQKKGWTSLDASIDGGIEIIAKEYIKKGQNTLYLQKFDVDNSDGQLYWHQYMQNLLAAQSEQQTLRNTYDEINSISSQHTFIIPLYKNMPASPCARPNTSGENVTSTDIVKVNVDSSLRLRDLPNGSKTLGWLWKNEYVTRLEKATSKIAGTYWDKVMKSDGTTGFVARETYESEPNYKLYLVPVGENDKPNDNSGNDNDDSNNKPHNTSKVQIDNNQNVITVVPEVVAQDILDAFGGSVKIVKADNSYLESHQSVIGTGYKVQDKYIVVKRGDCNGDGKIDSADLLSTQKHLLGVTVLTDAKASAADANKDSKIDSADLLKIQKYLLGVSNIEL